MSTFYDEVQKIRARYPEGSRSAALPALRLVQEKHGYLSREALDLFRAHGQQLDACIATRNLSGRLFQRGDFLFWRGPR